MKQQKGRVTEQRTANVQMSQTIGVVLACQLHFTLMPQLSHRVPRNLEKNAVKETQSNEVELQTNKDRKVHYAIG